ncbi:ent-kaurenoic acid oxidase 2 [Lathyrus oleraceus]|uniref:Ent-kaurenoic acid oxidase n=2 Tax=Pisum sativum TaxID=3888 RepID=Q84ZW0_PEA|nr:ent-kaurenoic acid oxidase 2-like [Pisum sativum]AAO23064.1 ent-kaurenoic acid oxidase [Pisum sativum]KAI5446707.1 Ent-kaurenoic acid oxidase 1 [Pisum sativum]
MASLWFIFGAIAGALLVLRSLLKNVNWFLYEAKLGDKQYSLPPGDMGWPIIGNMWSFLRAFKSSKPDSFMDSIVKRFGNTGIYKVFMFGFPSVIVTSPEACKKVLTDDENFEPGWPQSTVELIGEKSFIKMPFEEHRRLRRLTSASINGYEALSVYLKYIEEIVISSLEKWTQMGEIEFLTQMRKLTFKIIIHIFLGSESEPVMEALEREYTVLNLGVRAMRINIPGFAFHKSLKARKNLVAIFQSIVDKRRNERRGKEPAPGKKAKDMMDSLIDAVDENGRKLGDDEIIDIMLMYLNAGHESSGHITMWATYFLQRHPEFFRKAKEEQVEMLKRRPPSQKGLKLEDVRKMEYLSKVIDETMRVVTFSLMVFRQARNDVKVNGYLIPKGWRVLTWFRSVHFDSELYPDPREFNPENFSVVRKAGEFLPFGAGTRLCPGNDLAKLEISVFLHHFLLKYELEQLNPKSPIRFLPHTRPLDNCLARIKKQEAA